MASANLELVRSMYAAWNRGDLDAAFECTHPQIEFVIADGPSPGRWIGSAGVAAGFRDFMQAWEDYRLEAEEYREVDGERVLVLHHPAARGKRSGVDLGHLRMKTANVFHVRGGKVTRLAAYFSSERALADLGLPPKHGSRLS
jgi:ketosteroid isomerase-like protein